MCLFVCLSLCFDLQDGETALHYVAAIVPGTKSTDEDLVNIVQILLGHGGNLTLTTYQVPYSKIKVTCWKSAFFAFIGLSVDCGHGPLFTKTRFGGERGLDTRVN